MFLRMIGIAALLVASVADAQTCSVMESQKLLPEMPEANSGFGTGLAIAGDVIVVGRPFHDVPGTFSQAGSAEVWEFNGSAWQRTAVLRADTPDDGSFFGQSVDTDGDVIVVGAPREAFVDNGNQLSQPGAVYVFEKVGGVWTQTDRLISNEPEVVGHFGHSLSLDAAGLVIGEPLADYLPDSDSEAGAVHLFLRSGNSFSHSAKIQVPEASFRAQLGYDVAVEAGVIFASAPKEDAGGNDRGAVYIFALDTVWTVIGKLDDGTATNGFFGEKIDVRGGIVAVGAPSQGFGSGSGSVYVYDHAGGGVWNLTQQFNGTSTLGSDRFGGDVAFVDDTRMIVGAGLDDDGGPQTGSVFLFEKQGGTWTQVGGPFGNADRAAGDQYGTTVTASADTLVCTAIGNDDGAFGDGSVHVVDLVCESSCPGDIADDFGTLGGDGMVSFGDFLALLGLVGPCPGGTPGCDGDIADDFGTLGGDGMVSFGDFLALLGLVGPCP